MEGFYLQAWLKILEQYASFPSLLKFLKDIDPAYAKLRRVSDALDVIRELFADGKVDAERLATFVLSVLRSGSKHVYLYGVEEGTDLEAIVAAVQPAWDASRILETDLPDAATLLACQKAAGPGGWKVSWSYIQVLPKLIRDEAWSVRHEDVNYYVHVVLDTTVPWLVVILEPSENLREEDFGKRVSFSKLADQYVQRIVTQTHVPVSVMSGLHQEVLRELRRVATEWEHPKLAEHMDVLTRKTEAYLQDAAAAIGIPENYTEHLVDSVLYGWKGLLVEWYQEDQSWKPESPDAPGHVRRQRSFQTDGTVLETRSDRPIQQSQAHYSTEALVAKAQWMDRLEFMWNMPGGRMVRTLLEASESRALVSFLNHGTTEEEIWYVLSRVGEYRQQATDRSQSW